MSVAVPVLAAEAVDFAYGAGPPVFRGVDLAIRRGEVLCILGPNGVGKSTLLRCLAGLVAPTRGVVRLDGQRLVRLSRRTLGRAIGFVPQSDEPFFAFTAAMVVEMGRAPHLGWNGVPSARDIGIARAAMARLGIGHLADRLYPELSGGERQLVLMARALAQQPAVLILDEPTAHLDFANQAGALELIRALADDGLAVVMTSHDPGHAFLIAEQTLVMARRRPAQSGPTRQILTEALLSETYGRTIRIVMAGGRTICFAGHAASPAAAAPCGAAPVPVWLMG